MERRFWAIIDLEVMVYDGRVPQVERFERFESRRPA